MLFYNNKAKERVKVIWLYALTLYLVTVFLVVIETCLRNKFWNMDLGQFFGAKIFFDSGHFVILQEFLNS